METNAKPELSSSVDSSILKEISYDPFMGVMTVCFKNGGIYDYLEVPEETYQEFLQAPSVGKYFHIHIKNRFQFLKRK